MTGSRGPPSATTSHAYPARSVIVSKAAVGELTPAGGSRVSQAVDPFPLELLNEMPVLADILSVSQDIELRTQLSCCPGFRHKNCQKINVCFFKDIELYSGVIQSKPLLWGSYLGL